MSTDVAGIFGVKLKRLRKRASLSLKELSRKCGVSPSYLNEIEKGKKYPNPDKIVDIANALNVSFDSLVSLKLEQEVSISVLPETPLVQKFPFHMFGISAGDLNNLMADHPREMSTLVGVLSEFGRTYDLRAESFYHTAMRSYQILHRNYFPDLEKAVTRFRESIGWNPNYSPTSRDLWRLAEERYGYRIYEPHPEDGLEKLRAAFFHHQGKLYMNPLLTSQQKAFVIAREIAYRELGITERGYTSPSLEMGSFEQVINNFNAAYFADALQVPTQKLISEVGVLFRRPKWDQKRFLSLFQQFHVTPRMLFFRMTELLPQHFGLPNIHFLEFNRMRASPTRDLPDTKTTPGMPGQGISRRKGSRRKSDIKVNLAKQLNMSREHLPDGMLPSEHFCRRWLALAMLDRFERQDGNDMVVGIQRSRLIGSDQEFLAIGLAYPDSMNPRQISSVSLGFQMDEDFTSQAAFHQDPDIPFRETGQTCERCPLGLEECSERVAPPHLYEAEREREIHREHISRLIDRF